MSIESADCIVRHINAFIKQTHYKEVAHIGEPCEGCNQAEKCKFDWFAKMKPLIDGANEKIKVGF